MLNLHITGTDTLAAAARECCARHHNVQEQPDADTDIIWICEDTPIGPDDAPNVGFIVHHVGEQLKTAPTTAIILVSSQIPVGTMQRLEALHPGFVFAYSPENIRVKTAVADFENQARIIVGLNESDSRKHWHRAVLTDLLSPFTGRIIFTDLTTAECCKHAVNVWLGTSIAWANEFARFAKAHGADTAVITRALRTDFRVSPNAPLLPGAPFGGGHLARDIYAVNQIAKERGIELPLISRIMESNRIGGE